MLLAIVISVYASPGVVSAHPNHCVRQHSLGIDYHQLQHVKENEHALGEWRKVVMTPCKFPVGSIAFYEDLLCCLLINRCRRGKLKTGLLHPHCCSADDSGRNGQTSELHA